MPVHTVLEPSVAGWIDTWQPLELDGRRIWQNEPGPHQQNPPLTERDLAVVTTNQPRALRYQKVLASRSVVYRLGYGRDNLSR